MIFFYIPSSYTKILGETKFQPREFPRSGSKAMSVERREKERKSVITMVSTCTPEPIVREFGLEVFILS